MAIEEGVDLFRLAVDLSPSGMLAVDVTGNILLVNREVERLFGYSREELVGQPVERIVPDRVRSMHVSFRADYLLHPTTRRMGSGRELYGLHKDGSSVYVEIGLNPIQTAQGTVVLASVVDISARKRAEQRFEAAVESAPSGMVMTDEQGIIQLVNRETERLFGYDRSELVGRPVEMLVPSRFRAAHPGLRAAFYHAPRSRPMGAGRDLFGLRKDGSEVAIEIGLNPIRTDVGLYILSSIVDITTRRRSEDQLRQSQKLEAIGTLAGGIAHDFNNLLASIIGYTELAQRAALGEQRSDLEQVLKAAARGRQLVQRILAFSKQRDVARIPISPGRAVREALELLRASLPSTIEIQECIDPNTPEVLSDETQLNQVVMNLATNAAHAMPRGGKICVELSPFEVDDGFVRDHPSLRVGLHVRLVVSDDGQGMTDEVKKRAFEPFFTTKPAHEGSGLGLSVIHGIVQNHGGVIEIESQLQRGTRVEVVFPAYRPNGAEEGIMPRIPRILLVDDEAPLAALMKRQLEGAGYVVSAFTSSPDALEYFRAHAGDITLLLTDHTMPRMTGLALIQEVLGLRPDLPVMLASGLSDTANPEALYRQGVKRLLPKPYTSGELVEAVTALIGKPDKNR